MIFQQKYWKIIGFKPRYDQDTGKRYQYYKTFKFFPRYGIYSSPYEVEVEFSRLSKKWIFKQDIWKLTKANIFDIGLGDKILNLVYDLIKDEIVEKVRDQYV